MFSQCPGRSPATGSRGANSLIKQGAKLVETVDDVLVEFSYLQTGRGRERGSPSPQGIPEDLSGGEGALLRHLSLEPVHIDQLAERAGLTVSVAGSLLTMLEVKGLARRLPGNYFVMQR